MKRPTIDIEFLCHPAYPTAHDHLNSIYSDVLPGIDDLFTLAVHDQLLPDALAILCLKVATHFQTFAVKTTSVTAIPPLVHALMYQYEHSPAKCRNLGTVKTLASAPNRGWCV